MITSTSNAQIKELLRLQKKGRAREEAGVFIVEGPRMAAEIPPERIVKLYVSESYAKREHTSAVDVSCRYGKASADRLLNLESVSLGEAEVLSDPVFARVSDTKTPQGVLAVVKRQEYTMADILGVNPDKGETTRGGQQTSREPHVLVLDNLQDPGNLGTIFRTAEAAGATGLILSRGCVDIYNPKVIRSTMGAVFRVPFLYTDDLPGAVGELKKAGIRVYAAHLEGGNAYDEEDYRGGCAFLIGNEGNGLRDEVTVCADCLIRIHMQGQTESLNAAVAAAVLMFEVGRQRRS